LAPVVVVSAGAREHGLLFNPRIVGVADETETGEEGSVSLPGVRVAIGRPVWADVESMDAAGKLHSERFVGFLGRVAQHEIEQMQGNFFLDRLSRLKREMVLKKLKKQAG
jgi:peptide deformylase